MVQTKITDVLKLIWTSGSQNKVLKQNMPYLISYFSGSNKFAITKRKLPKMFDIQWTWNFCGPWGSGATCQVLALLVIQPCVPGSGIAVKSGSISFKNMTELALIWKWPSSHCGNIRGLDGFHPRFTYEQYKDIEQVYVLWETSFSLMLSYISSFLFHKEDFIWDMAINQV